MTPDPPSRPEPPPTPTVPPHLPGARLDRAAHLRGQTLPPGSLQVLTVYGARALLRDGEPVLLRDDDIPAAPPVGPRSVRQPALIFLGEREGVLYAARSAGDDAEARVMEEETGGRFEGLRTLAARLDPELAALYAYAAALHTWHGRARYCGSCGAPTRPELSGHQRGCTSEACGAVLFPRTDPAIITLPCAGERCLLLRQPAWPEGRFSTLAGFVEPGETLEAAVAREVAEEVGLRVVRTRYAYSQPWPFPHTLMVGFRTEVEPGDVRLGDEIADARWLTRPALRDAVASGDMTIPPPFALSRTLIEDWLDEV